MAEQDNTPAGAVPVPPMARGNCGNCGSPLLGEYCYACGQPVKGLVRHFGSILGDFADTVLNWDARLPRTLWPLLVRPGFLTCEYFAGRRVRYVSPVRLFVTLAIVTFFVAQLMLSFGSDVRFDGVDNDVSFSRATTVEEVIEQRDEALADLAKARAENRGVPGLSQGLGAADQAIRQSAEARIRALQKSARGNEAARAEAAATTSTAGKSTGEQPGTGRDAPGADVSPPSAAPSAADASSVSASVSVKDDDEDDNNIAFNGKPWHPVTNPLTVSWWPDFANRWLNAQVGRAKENIGRMQKDPDLFKDAVLGAVPTTLFVLLPVFALMLLVLYVFRRRMYMEHLLVALHSHAFLCFALLLVLCAMALQDWLAPRPGALRTLFTLMEAALWTWMPLYLLLMQKKVYRQGWFMTLLKYSVLGFCYFMLLSFGAAFTVLFSVVAA